MAAAEAARAATPRPAVPLCINCRSGAGVQSDYMVAAVLAYSRELTQPEIMQVEEYLSAMYSIPLGRPPYRPAVPSKELVPLKTCAHTSLRAPIVALG